LSALNGQDNAADATPLAPPSLLSSSSSLSSAITEEDVAGGVPSSIDADLDAVPATKEDVVDADDDGATVAAVIPTPVLDIAYLTIHVDARALAFTRCKNLPPRHLPPRHFGETSKTHSTT
jgi:hypothetical protein